MGRHTEQTDEMIRTGVRGFHQGTRAYSPSSRCRIYDCNLSFIHTAVFPLQCEADHIWIKQNLKIKRFLGRSDNAVRIQLLTALITYLLIDLYRQRHRITTSLHLLVAELSVTLFQRPQVEAYVTHRYRRRRLEFEELQGKLAI